MMMCILLNTFSIYLRFTNYSIEIQYVFTACQNLILELALKIFKWVINEHRIIENIKIMLQNKKLWTI